MADHVFISHSSKDKTAADALCRTLEQRAVRCWIAPRDIHPGLRYAEALLDAIYGSRLMVLVFTASANASPHVDREVEHAASKGIPILMLRLEDVPLSKSLEYFVTSHHWLDTVGQPLETALERLADTVPRLLAQAAPVHEAPPEAGPRSQATSPDTPEHRGNRGHDL